MKEGFVPDSISTDLHIGSMNAGMKDMLNVMDKFLAMGHVARRCDAAIDVESGEGDPPRGTGTSFSRARAADIAVLRLEKGSFGFVDMYGARLRGTQKLDVRADAARRQGGLRPQRDHAAGLDHAAEGLPADRRRALGRPSRPRRSDNRRDKLAPFRSVARGMPVEEGSCVAAGRRVENAGLRPLLPVTASIHTLVACSRNRPGTGIRIARVTLARSTRRLRLRPRLQLSLITRLARGGAQALLARRNRRSRSARQAHRPSGAAGCWASLTRYLPLPVNETVERLPRLS